MRHYPSFENQKYDHTLDNDMIIAENKIDGQILLQDIMLELKNLLHLVQKR